MASHDRRSPRMKTPTHPYFNPAEHCGKRQAWAYDGGICLQPAGHETRCRFVWDAGDLLGGVSGGVAATDGLCADHEKPFVTTGAFGAISPPQHLAA